MEVIKRNDLVNGFELEITCAYKSDQYGFGYGKKEDYCNSVLKINAQDIYKRKWFKYPDYEGVDYGVICPVCQNFVIIDDTKIPKQILDNAKEWK